MAFNVAKIASARSSLAISLTKSLSVAGPLGSGQVYGFIWDLGSGGSWGLGALGPAILWGPLQGCYPRFPSWVAL